MTEFHAGDIVGGYRLEARLGGGGFGTVWRARDAQSGRLVAIKLLPELEAGAEDARLAADIELLAASAAGRSQHIVHVLAGGVEPVPYIVMEFISGKSLAEELRERRTLSAAETVDIGLGILDALNALNAVGIIHRDIKPSNVMIDRDGLVKLTDFGIAKIVGYDTKTQTGDLRLSIAYAAPEVWEGQAEHRSDLYSLGILLFQCLTGTLPFRGGYAELFYQHRSVEADLAPLPDGLPAGIERLIGACLQKSPAARPPSAAACIPLLRQAKAALETMPPAALTKEPDRFGQWLIVEPHPDRDWSWICHHERSGEVAVVDVLFANSASYGETLRRVVDANKGLASLGAERLLQANRLILRPGEAWNEPPPAPFQFWLAREKAEPPEPPAVVTPALLLRAVEGLMALLAAAREANVALDMRDGRLSLREDGGIYVEDPGLVPEPPEGPEIQSIEFLRDLPMTRDLRPIVFGASRLDDIRRAVSALVAMRDTLPLRSDANAVAGRPSKVPLLAAGLGATGLVAAIAVIAALTVLRPGAVDDGVEPGPTAIPRSEVLVQCLAMTLPVPIATFENLCGALEPGYVQDLTCPRGTVCNRQSTGADTFAIGINSRTLAYVDESGNLSIAADGAEDVAQLTGHGSARYPVWSPDGRYVAYVQTQRLGGSGDRYSTQLRVIEADRRGNDGIVLATNGADSEPPWQQRYIVGPQWAADGQSLIFLWTTPDGGSAGLYSIDLPLSGRGSEIDFAVLRSAAPANEAILSDRVSAVSLNAGDFGVNDGYLGRILIQPSGVIFVQVCDGPNDRRRCGLGRWDGAASLIMPLQDDVALGVPAAIPNATELYVSRWQRNQGWRLIKIATDGARSGDKETAVPAPEDVLGFPVPRFTLGGKGERIVFETAAGDLHAVPVQGGQAAPLAKGRAPIAYQPFAGGLPIGTQLGRSPFATPTPTPVPTATPQPRFVAMTLFVTVRRGSTPLTNVELVAYVGAENCASARTDNIGRVTLTFPRDGAAARCGEAGALIRFGIEGTILSTTVPYAPQTAASVELNLPP